MKRNVVPGGLLTMVGIMVIALPQLAQPGQPTQSGKAEELDEVTVKGVSLRRMRAELVAMEDRFYALYNQLNKDNDFDVHCYNEAPLGTLIRSRVCRVAYVEEAQADSGQAFVAGLRSGAPAQGAEAPEPESVELARQEEFRTNALKVINTHPRLQRLAREREALQKRYLEEVGKLSRRQGRSGQP